MAKIFTYEPHPQIQARKVAGPTKVDDVRHLDHPNPIVRFNAKFGLKITLIVGTMWCAYLFTVLALVSAPSAFKSGNQLIIVAWIAQTFLQLVLLPVIIVGQNIQSAASDMRAEQTYKDAEAVLHEALQIEKHLEAQDTEIEKILADLNALKAG
jgi:hypothetical protein